MSSMANLYLNEANKLNGVNYVSYKFNMKILMEWYNVYAIESGDEAKKVAHRALLQDWEKRKTKEKGSQHHSTCNGMHDV